MGRGIDNYGSFSGDRSGAHYRGTKIACPQCESCEYYFYEKSSNPHCCSHSTQSNSIAAQKSDGIANYGECKVYEPKKEKQKKEEKPGKKQGNLCCRIFCCLCKCLCKQIV